MPATLGTLPLELQTMVAKELRNVRDLVSLAGTCHSLHDAVLPFIYETVRFRAEDDIALSPRLFRTLLYVQPHAPLQIRHIHVLGHWLCSSYRRPRLVTHSGDPEPLSAQEQSAELMMLLLLGKIPEGRLLSFYWELNSIMSQDIMVELLNRQQNLQTLALTFEPSSTKCPGVDQTRKFPELQSLTCRNVSTSLQLNFVRNLIKSVAKGKLKQLNISCCYTDIEDILADPEEPNRRMLRTLAHFLYLEPTPRFTQPPKAFLPSRKLSVTKHLSHFGLGRFPLPIESFDVLNRLIPFSTLTSLALLWCPGTGEFLDTWREDDTQNINLKRLHIMMWSSPIGDVDGDRRNAESVNQFIDCFSGLEEFYLLSEAHEYHPVDELWSHAKTLKKLVLDLKWVSPQQGRGLRTRRVHAIEIYYLLKRCRQMEELGICLAEVGHHYPAVDRGYGNWYRGFKNLKVLHLRCQPDKGTEHDDNPPAEDVETRERNRWTDQNLLHVFATNFVGFCFEKNGYDESELKLMAISNSDEKRWMSDRDDVALFGVQKTRNALGKRDVHLMKMKPDEVQGLVEAKVLGVVWDPNSFL